MLAGLSPEKYDMLPRTSPQPACPSSAVSRTKISSSAVTRPVKWLKPGSSGSRAVKTSRRRILIGRPPLRTARAPTPRARRWR